MRQQTLNSSSGSKSGAGSNATRHGESARQRGMSSSGQQLRAYHGPAACRRRKAALPAVA